MKSIQRNFRIIILLVILQKSQYLISVYTGIDIFSWFPFSPFVLIMAIVVWALYRVNSSRGGSIFSIDPFLTLILFYSSLMFFLGAVYNNVDIVLQEFSTALLVFYAYVLGRNGALDFTNNFYLYVVIVASSLTLLGSFHFRENLIDELDLLTPTATLAYEISPILDIWPLVFLSKYFTKRNLISFIPLILYLAFQFFFMKRAPTIRAITYFFAAQLLLLFYSKNILKSFKKISYLIMIVIGLLFYMPKGLKERFSQKDLSRQNEAVHMLDQLSPQELIFGMGLGGWFELKDGGGIIELHNGLMGKYIVHIGVVYPILKGGLVFLILILLHYFYSLNSAMKKIYVLNIREKAAFIFLIVYGVFRLIEGPFSPGALFDGLCFGYSIGVLNERR